MSRFKVETSMPVSSLKPPTPTKNALKKVWDVKGELWRKGESGKSGLSKKEQQGKTMLKRRRRKQRQTVQGDHTITAHSFPPSHPFILSILRVHCKVNAWAKESTKVLEGPGVHACTHTDTSIRTLFQPNLCNAHFVGLQADICPLQ